MYYLDTAVVGGTVFISPLVQLTLGHVSCNTMTHWSRLLQPVEGERGTRHVYIGWPLLQLEIYVGQSVYVPFGKGNNSENQLVKYQVWYELKPIWKEEVLIFKVTKITVFTIVSTFTGHGK